MKNIKYLLIFLLIPIFSFAIHKYYVSLTQIDYSKNSKTLEITVRVFINDFDNALDKQFQKNIYLGEKNEDKNADKFIVTYFKNNFEIKVNKQLKAYNFIGKEYDNNICYVYFEIPNVTKVSSLEVTNSILQEIFEQQQNLIKTNINNIHHDLILTASNDKGLLKY